MKTICCPNCKSNNVVKNGVFRNRQRFLCQTCKKQFSEANRENSIFEITQERHALHLYLEKNSYKKIASLLDFDDSTLHRNLNKYNSLLADIRSSQSSEELSLMELRKFIDLKQKLSPSYPIFLIDLETGISYISKSKSSSQNEIDT